MNPFRDVMKLCDHIRQTSFDLHKYLRHGHMEKVYRNGLVHRLRKSGLKVEPRLPLNVYDEDGTLLGEYEAGLLVDWPLIIEIKACDRLHEAHTAQILGYLRASRIEHGLLINFGAPRLQIKKLAFLDDYPGQNS